MTTTARTRLGVLTPLSLILAAALTACSLGQAPDSNLTAAEGDATVTTAPEGGGDGADDASSDEPAEKQAELTSGGPTTTGGEGSSDTKANTVEKLVTDPAVVDSVSAAVVKSWNAYRTAVQAEDGAAAVKAVSADSIQQMQVWKEMALINSWEELTAGRALDVLSVMRLRAQIPADDVRSDSAKQLYAAGVEAGMIGDPAILKRAVAEVEVHESMAIADLKQSGSQPEVRVVFVKDGKAWKVAVNSISAVLEQTIVDEAKAASATTTEYIVATVADIVGTKAAKAAEEPLGSA